MGCGVSTEKTLQTTVQRGKKPEQGSIRRNFYFYSKEFSFLSPRKEGGYQPARRKGLCTGKGGEIPWG